MKIPTLAPLLVALTLAAACSRLVAGHVDAPSPVLVATDVDGGTSDPPPDDPDSRPSPTLPLPPPAAALAFLAR